MSIKLNERYPGRFNNPTAAYPQGSFKNRTAPGALDGSYLEKDWANDKEGFFQSLLSAAGLVANGVVDSVGASQYYSALTTIISNLSPSPPDASTTVKGIVELATDAETQTGTDAVRAITPANLTARTATETRTGIIELATAAETQAGTDAFRGVTPATLASLTSTATRAGLVELATDAETQTGTDTQRAITPGNLSSRTATETRTGIISLATTAELLAGTDAAKAATAAGILAGILGAGGTSTNDYLIIPYRDKTGGTRRNFYVMWGRTTTAATGLGPVTFPIAFPNSVLNIVTSVTKTGGALTTGSGWLTDTLTLTGVTLASQTAQATPIAYIAIGW